MILLVAMIVLVAPAQPPVSLYQVYSLSLSDYQVGLWIISGSL